MNVRCCLNCDDGTKLHHGERDLTVAAGTFSEQLQSVSGWHCPVCGEVEFDDGEGERYASALLALQKKVTSDQAQLLRKVRQRSVHRRGGSESKRGLENEN